MRISVNYHFTFKHLQGVLHRELCSPFNFYAAQNGARKLPDPLQLKFPNRFHSKLRAAPDF